MTKFSLILSPLTSYPVSFPDQYLLNLTWTRSPVLYCQRCQQSICSQASHINSYTFARVLVSSQFYKTKLCKDYSHLTSPVACTIPVVLLFCFFCCCCCCFHTKGSTSPKSPKSPQKYLIKGKIHATEASSLKPGKSKYEMRMVNMSFIPRIVN